MPSNSERHIVKIVYRYVYMTELVTAALELLREHSPVGSNGDPHPGLYRDSHLVFLNGQLAPGGDVSAWQPGDQINIANPVPYARKIEFGHMTLSVPGHVYETVAQILAGRFGNQAAIKLTFMPVRFGSIGAFAAMNAGGRAKGRKVTEDWLARQPSIEIRGYA